MKCKVCGAESGKYPLCRVCNLRKEKGEVIKCASCGNWHLSTFSCIKDDIKSETGFDKYLYESKKVLISHSEQSYYNAIIAALPKEYHVFPQVNLASFIIKTDDSPFHNELFRNVDFLITNASYKPLFVVEINDQTHLNKDRQERDEKVRNICEEAGIPILKFWTSYGVNTEYISKKTNETIASLPVKRVHHFDQNATQTNKTSKVSQTQLSPQGSRRNPFPSHTPYRGYNRYSKKAGCYIATCIYGSYDCPEVWILRRYRDANLSVTWYGRLFIKIYYFISPIVVKLFGNCDWFHKLFKPTLNKLVNKLSARGFEDTPYNDTN